MLNPKDYKTKQEFLDACLSEVLKTDGISDGDAKKQATATCYSMWKNRDEKSGESVDPLDQTLPEELQQSVPNLAVAALSQQGEHGSEDGESERHSMAGTDSTETSSEQNGTTQGANDMADVIDKKAIKQEVEVILAEKDAQQKVEARIAGLEQEKSDLAEQLNEKGVCVAKLSQELEESKTEAATATSEKDTKVQDLEKEKEELSATATRLETELNKLREAQTIAARTKTLTETSLILPEGEARDAQVAKASAMSDEDFESYKAEMTAFAETIKAQAGKSKTDEEEDAEEGAADKANASEEDTGEGEDGTKNKAQSSVEDDIEQADLSEGDTFRRSISALTQDVKPDDDQVAVYSQM